MGTIQTCLNTVIVYLVLIITQVSVDAFTGRFGRSDYGETSGDYSANNCQGLDCDYFNSSNDLYQDYYSPTYMDEDEIWNEVQSKLDSNVTKAFVESFDTAFEQRMIFEQLSACPYISMCEFDLGVQYLQQYSKIRKDCCLACRCDYPVCLKDKSCCIDVVYRYTNKSDWLRSDPEPQKTCEKMYLSDEAPPEHTLAVMMHASCPKHTPETLLSNCTKIYIKDMHSFKEVVPVYYVDTQEMYRNVYCAYCHNISDDKLQSLEVWLECNKPVSASSESDLIEYAMSEEKCYLRYRLSPEVVIALKYCMFTVRTCNQTGHWLFYDEDLEQACGLHFAPFQLNGIKYQNVFCALCNGIVINNPSGCTWGFGFEGSTFSFSGLLKLETHSHAGNKIRERNKCSEDQLFDSIYGICRDMFCSSHQTLRDGNCSDVYSVLQNIIFSVFLKITPLETLTVLEANLVANYVLSMIKGMYWFNAEVCGLQMIYTSHVRKTDNDTISTADVLESPFKSFIVRAELLMIENMDPNQFVEMVLSLNQLENTILYYDEVLGEMKSLKIQLQVIDRDSNIFDEIGTITEFDDVNRPFYFDVPIEAMIEYFTSAGVSGDPDLEFAHIRGNDGLAKCRSKFFKINVLQMKSCPQIALARNDTNWKESDNGVIIERGDFLIKNSEYYLHENGSLIICVKVYEKYMAFLSNNINGISLSSETIVSIVSSSLSIFCLSFTLIMFTLLPRLRNSLPGKNNICLVVALLCSQSMYLITGLGALEVGSTACVAFGMVLHFTWLVSLFWMNVCTYHMFHVLSRTMAISKNSGTCRFLVYHSYAIIMSIIPVAINSSVAMATSGLYGYGDVVCYISTQNMVTLTFGIPVAFVVVSNIVMFLLVMIKIKTTTMVQRNLKNERNNLLIFAKLSTITGMTWIFGFINIWANMKYFIIAVCLFGLAVAFPRGGGGDQAEGGEGGEGGKQGGKKGGPMGGLVKLCMAMAEAVGEEGAEKRDFDFEAALEDICTYLLENKPEKEDEVEAMERMLLARAEDKQIDALERIMEQRRGGKKGGKKGGQKGGETEGTESSDGKRPKCGGENATLVENLACICAGLAKMQEEVVAEARAIETEDDLKVSIQAMCEAAKAEMEANTTAAPAERGYFF
ncbi:hypothetical protein ACF0H5_014090 [Mactra antiquata]